MPREKGTVHGRSVGPLESIVGTTEYMTAS
jgi:hypothetical protein